MLLTQDNPQGKYQIRNYQPGSITVNEAVYSQSLIITMQSLVTDWPPQKSQQLLPEHFAMLLAYEPAVVLIGTGAALEFIPAAVLAPLINQQIGFEIMATAAACRTFNILSAEGRNVVAALIIE